MVQLPETIQNAQYSNICEIGEERIRRAGKKIKEENPLTTTNLDIGFRVFKIDSSNMEDVYYRPADYNQGQMELFADNIKPDRTPEDLLFQVMLDLGILLSSDIQETEIAGKKVFSVADGYLIACFDKDVTEETVKAIAQKQPVYAVFRDSSMASDSVASSPEGWVYAPMHKLNWQPIDKAKLDCARKLFHNFSSADVVYDSVDSYQHLLDIMNKL